MTPAHKHLVAIATYRRPEALQRLLDSLEKSIDSARVDILVVDNDANSSARDIVANHSLRPRYVVEREPGIASARNRALDHFGEEFSAILFVDDDEWVADSWYDTIVAYAEGETAGVVQGPVITVLPADSPRWIRRGQFFQRPIQPTGTRLRSAATNNVLLARGAWLQAGSPRFDPAFSTTGGSDFDLFWGIGKTGSVMTYCAEAVVYEDVPLTRMSWTWLRRRYTRIGIGIVNSRRKHGDPLGRFLAITLAAFVVGSAQLFADVVLGRGPRAVAVERIFKSVGVFTGLLGHRIHEYRR